MFAIIGAFLQVVATTIGVMTLIEGIGEKDLKKALIGGLTAYAGYSGLQSSIASAAGSGAGGLGDVASSGMAAETPGVSDTFALGSSEPATVMTPLKSTVNPSGILVGSASNTIPQATQQTTQATLTPIPQKTVPKSSILDTTSSQATKGSEAITKQTGSGVFDKIAGWAGDLKNMDKSTKDMVATLIGKGMDYSAALQQASLIKEQNGMATRKYNNQNNPIDYGATLR